MALVIAAVSLGAPLTVLADPVTLTAPELVGLELAEALARLGQAGLRLVYSSEVVRPGMVVAAMPVGATPRDWLTDLLQPHGLTWQEGAGGTLVIVVLPQESRPLLTLRGIVRRRVDGEPIVGASVRLVDGAQRTKSGVGGAFELRDLPPGSGVVEARLPGYVVVRLEVEAGGAAGSPIELLLDAAPLTHDEVLVTPSRVSLMRVDPVAPLGLDQRAIDSLPHLGNDLFRALSLLPGVAANDVTAQPQVRGGRRDEVKIVLDGQELYDAYHLADLDNALSVVAAETLESVDLTTGGFSAAHGERMGGILDMTTRSFVDAPHGEVELSLLNFGVGGSGRLAGDRGAWFGLARRGTIDLASRLLGGGSPQFWDGFGKLRLDHAGGASSQLSLLLSGDSEQETVIGEEPKNRDADDLAGYLWFRHEHLLGRQTLFEGAASLSRLRGDRAVRESEEGLLLDYLDLRASEVGGLRLGWNRQRGPQTVLSWGAELTRFSTDYDFHSLRISDDPVARLRTQQEAETEFDEVVDDTHLGAWASGRWQLSDALTLELGLRSDRHELPDDAYLSPRLNLAYALGTAAVVRASWGHVVQSLRSYELLVADGEPTVFRPERSEQSVLGYERLFGEDPGNPVLVLRVEGYVRTIDQPRPRYENLFEPLNAFPEGEPDRVRIAPEASRARGIELFLRGRLGPRSSWWLTYTRSSSEDRLDGRWVPREIDQPHALNLDLHTSLGRRWALNLAWRYHTGWPTSALTVEAIPVGGGEDGGEQGEGGDEGAEGDGEGPGPDDLEFVPVLGPLNAERFPSYHRLDLRLSRAFALRRGELELYIDVQNLYDRKNIAGFDFEIDQETGELTTNIERWTGILPSAGVRWRF